MNLNNCTEFWNSLHWQTRKLLPNKHLSCKMFFSLIIPVLSYWLSYLCVYAPAGLPCLTRGLYQNNTSNVKIQDHQYSSMPKIIIILSSVTFKVLDMLVWFALILWHINRCWLLFTNNTNVYIYIYKYIYIHILYTNNTNVYILDTYDL